MGSFCSRAPPPPVEEVTVRFKLASELPYDVYICLEHHTYMLYALSPDKGPYFHDVTLTVPRGGVRTFPVWKLEERNGVDMRVKVCDGRVPWNVADRLALTEGYVRFDNALEDVLPEAKVVDSPDDYVVHK